MDTNNYLGSFAQENVSFQTIVVESSSYGENFQRVMIFADHGLISDTEALVAVDGSDTIKVATVTADDYASITTGILQAWLTDLFASGETEEAYVVVDTTATVLTAEKQEEMYELLKAYAYWKTTCVFVQADSTADPAVAEDKTALDGTRFNTLAAALADLCQVDKQTLSGPVLAPLSTATASNWASDVRYTSLKDKFVFMSYCADATRNGALFSVGLALSVTNSSGTPVGNSLCFTKTTSMTASKATKPVRSAMNSAYIQTWKPVGDNSANVAAEVELDLQGNTVPALWIVAYVTYMTKVQIAVIMTVPNFYRNADSYARILNILQGTLELFTGRITGISITAPGFASLPASSSKELQIPNAWEATYVDTVTKVTISGTLYIGE